MAINTRNVILVGESGVGKTSMTIRYVRNKYFKLYNTTIAVDCYFKDITVDGTDVKLQIWDTSGQEIYKAIVPQYFRVAHGCILVYDVTRITTFHKLSGWLSEFRAFNEKAPVIIVGNKSEDPNCKAVNRSVIKSYADQEEMDFMECSAKTGENIEQAFDLLVDKMLENTKEAKCSQSMSSNVLEKESRELSHQNNSISYESREEPRIILTAAPPKSVQQPKKKERKCC